MPRKNERRKTFPYPFRLVALVLLTLSLLPLPLEAAEAETVRCDLQRCILLAIANHPTLKAGEAGRSTAQAIAAVKKAERNPQLFLEGGAGYLTGESINSFAVTRGVDEEGFRQRNVSGDYYQTVAGLDFLIFEEGAFWGSPSKSMEQAQLRVSEEEWKVTGLHIQLASEVAEAYFNVLKNSFAKQTYEKIVSLFKRDYEVAKARFAQEQVSRNDLLLADVRLATGNREFSAAQLAWKRSRSELASSLGLKQGQEIEVEDMEEVPTPLLPKNGLIARGHDDHPELQALRLEVKARKKEVERVRSERYPRFHLRTHYGFADDFSGNYYDQFLALLEMRWSIFDFGLISNKIVAAQSQVTEEEARLRSLQMKIDREVRETLSNLQDLDQEVILLEKRLEQAKEAVQLNQSLLQTGSVSESVVHELEASVCRLEIARRQAEYDRKLAHFRLALARGEEKR